MSANFYSQSKLKLSKRLSFGVGRASLWPLVFRYGTSLLILASVVLGIRAGYLVIQSDDSDTPKNPQILGVSTQKPTLFTTYKVNKGDTLFSVAQNFQVDWTILATINNLEAPFSLKPGQTIKIPSK